MIRSYHKLIWFVKIIKLQFNIYFMKLPDEYDKMVEENHFYMEIHVESKTHVNKN